MIKVSLGNAMGVAGQGADGAQDEVDGGDFDDESGEDEAVSEVGQSRSDERVVRNYNQPEGEAGK